ncbi:hypothetical protein EVA_05478 [gut metagenome]|uniref:Uncharacterized protein n=1 Tax=gut metagenome TaxID=749906 RepID=J9GZM7_9ZZZZ
MREDGNFPHRQSGDGHDFRKFYLRFLFNCQNNFVLKMISSLFPYEGEPLFFQAAPPSCEAR